MKYLFTYIILSVSIILHAQVKEDYRYFLDKATGNIYKNPETGLRFTQELMMNDKNSDRIFYQHIAAQSYVLQGDYVNAAKSVFDKSQPSKEDKDDFHQFFLTFCLADQYQNLGLYEQSQKILSEVIEKGNFPDHLQRDITLAKIFQLQAINLVILGKYDTALEHLKKSSSYITSQNEESQILKVENTLNRGITLLHQKKIAEAEKTIQEVFGSKTLQNYPYLNALAKEYFSRVQFMKQNYGESTKLLEEALNIIGDLNFNVLKLKIYEGLSKAYLAENNNIGFQKNRQLYEELKTRIDDNTKSATSYLVGVLEDVNNNKLAFYESETSSLSTSIGFASLFLVLFLGIIYYSTVRKEKDLHKQIAFFEGYSDKMSAKVVPLEKPQATEDTGVEKAPAKETKKTSLISPEKEQELLTKLEDFEKSERYLTNQMSLPFLAAELETNIKYLSEIIKIHKEKKFNAYINDLRIRHIINLLRTDPVYLNYKVSYLAEISGFSSHSAFTAVFKSITGMSPNDFIQQLNHHTTS